METEFVFSSNKALTLLKPFVMGNNRSTIFDKLELNTWYGGQWCSYAGFDGGQQPLAEHFYFK
jgi:hypothetical protein